MPTVVAVDRESACPVHFLWDGKRHGRPFVRAGFVGFLLASMLLCAAVMLPTVAPASVLRSAGGWLGAVSGASWLLGHAIARLRWPRRTPV